MSETQYRNMTDSEFERFVYVTTPDKMPVEMILELRLRWLELMQRSAS